MYGSSLIRVTLRPRDSRIAAREAEAIPLPREDTTPPVTKTNLVMSGREVRSREVVKRDYKERPRPGARQGQECAEMPIPSPAIPAFFRHPREGGDPGRPAILGALSPSPALPTHGAR